VHEVGNGGLCRAPPTVAVVSGGWGSCGHPEQGGAAGAGRGRGLSPVADICHWPVYTAAPARQRVPQRPHACPPCPPVRSTPAPAASVRAGQGGGIAIGAWGWWCAGAALSGGGWRWRRRGSAGTAANGARRWRRWATWAAVAVAVAGSAEGRRTMMRWDDGWDAEPRRKPWSRPFRGVNHLENPGNSCWPPVNVLGKPCKLVTLPVNHLEGSTGYYEIVSFVLAPRCLVPEPTFAGPADSAAALIRPAVPRTALRSRWDELTGHRELHIPNLSPLSAARPRARLGWHAAARSAQSHP
jgi:hypothetical protein